MSELIKPLIKNVDTGEPKTVSINFNSYISGSDSPVISDTIKSDFIAEDTPKKKGRPPRQVAPGTIVKANQDNELTLLQSNTPYLSSYNETNNLLRGSIMDIDGLNSIVVGQLENVIESKTLRKKYDYVSELSSTAANLIGTRVRTISEMNKVISDAHNLDIKRMKELKIANSADEANSDKRMMDMYSAFINTPVGSYGGQAPPAFPTMQEMTMTNNTGLIGIDVGSQSSDAGYNEWRSNISPETNRMILDRTNKNIQTVVVYDQTTNNKYFDVIDRTTGQSIPNVPRPDPFLLGDTYPNVNNGTARNSNIDEVYPLVLTGAPSSINDY